MTNLIVGARYNSSINYYGPFTYKGFDTKMDHYIFQCSHPREDGLPYEVKRVAEMFDIDPNYTWRMSKATTKHLTLVCEPYDETQEPEDDCL